jgi:hypothetical protein
MDEPASPLASPTSHTAMVPDECTARAMRFQKEVMAHNAKMAIAVRPLLCNNGSAFRSRDADNVQTSPQECALTLRI